MGNELASQLKQGSPLAWNDEARLAAIQWGYEKGDNSGRIAYQFACRRVGKQLLKQQQTARS